MRSAPCLVLIALAAGLALAPRGEAAEVYKWTDSKGVVHYADSPPDGQKYERMKVGSGTTTASSPDPVPVQAPPPEAGSTEEAIARYKATRAQNCKIARDNIAQIQSSPDVQKDFDGDGVPEPMTAEQREAEIAANEALVIRSCD